MTDVVAAPQAEENVVAAPMANPPANGKTQALAKIIAGCVASCIVIEGIVALAALKWGVQDWNIVNALSGNLNTLATMLAGGLLALAKPSTEH